jgi:hypothetical protein
MCLALTPCALSVDPPDLTSSGTSVGDAEHSSSFHKEHTVCVFWGFALRAFSDMRMESWGSHLSLGQAPCPFLSVGLQGRNLA